MIDYVKVIDDLNSDIYEKYGDEAESDGFWYTYSTSGTVDIIEFNGVVIFYSEDYYPENDDISIAEFEDYLKDVVSQIGQKFLKYSFTYGSEIKISKGAEEEDMRDLYCVTTERLWEKLEFHKSKFDLKSVNLKQPFPSDKILPHSLFLELVNEVEKEFNCQMSNFQGSWAVIKFINGASMNKYNEANGTCLRPRE